MAVLFSILGLLGIPVGVYLASLCVRGGVSYWAWAWLLVYVFLDGAALFAQSIPRRSKICLGIGLALLAVVGGLRHSKSHPTAAGLTLRLPSGSPGPWVDRLGDDGDLGMMVFVAMADFGGVRGDDARRVKPFLRAAWRRLRADPEYGPVPSPVPSNLLGRTSAESLHTLVLNPQERAPRSIILLHGTGGSQKLPCYLLAQRMPDALVLCPTIGMGGEWANGEGVAAWNHLLTYAQAHSSAVYVVGHGYGGRGLLHLLSQNLLGHVAGAALVAGFDENYFDAVRRSQIPLLVIRGDADVRTPAFRVEGVAGLERVQSVELTAGHFVLYEQEDEVLGLLDTFCGAH